MRQEACEQMAKRVAVAHGDDWGSAASSYRVHAREDMAVALRALLDFLEANAAEFKRGFWQDLAAVPEGRDMVDELVSVLREVPQ